MLFGCIVGASRGRICHRRILTQRIVFTLSYYVYIESVCSVPRNSIKSNNISRADCKCEPKITEKWINKKLKRKRRRRWISSIPTKQSVSHSLSGLPLTSAASSRHLSVHVAPDANRYAVRVYMRCIAACTVHVMHTHDTVELEPFRRLISLFFFRYIFPPFNFVRLRVGL